MMLRRLVSTLRKEAPKVRINVRPIAADYADQLHTGLADLFVLPREIEQSGARLLSEDLFTDRLVCAVGADNEIVGDSMSRRQFEALPYLAYDGGVLTSAAQWQLRSQGIDRPIDVTTQSFVVAPLLLRGTPFFTVIHERLGKLLGPQNGLRLVESPVRFTPITEAMFWAERHNDSPSHLWLRDQLRRTAANLD